MKELFAILAALLVIFGHAPYVRSMLRGRIAPHPYTWFIGALISGIVLFGQLAGGAGVGVLPTTASCLFSLTIFLLSLRYGFTAITRADTALFGLALCAIVPWFFTDDPTLSVVLAVLIDAASYWPTVRKTWRSPRSEPMTVYVTNLLRHGLSLLSLEAYNIATAFHSASMLLINVVMIGLVSRGSKQK